MLRRATALKRICDRQRVQNAQNKWCNFVFGSTFALYGLMADSLAGL